jgi:hypothetical protein
MALEQLDRMRHDEAAERRGGEARRAGHERDQRDRSDAQHARMPPELPAGMTSHPARFVRSHVLDPGFLDTTFERR